MIDLAEIWIAFELLAPGEGARVMEIDYSSRVKQVCEIVAKQDAAGIEVSWGSSTSAQDIASMPSSSEGKQFYVAWLKDRYGYSITKLNSAYGLEATSFTDLTENDFKNVDRTRKEVAEDDRLFLEDLSVAMKEKISTMFQRCAPGRKTAWKRNRT